jgi:ABC-type multidrug transport system fused ATPase/permease subunit
MSLWARFVRYHRFFAEYAGRRIWLLVVLMLLMAQAEAVGIALLFPILGGGVGLPRPLEAVLHGMGITPTLGLVLTLLAVAFVVKGGFQLAATTYQYRVSADVTRRIRTRMTRAIAGADYLHVAGINSGILTNIVTTEVSRTTTGLVYFTKLFPHVLAIAIFFGIVLYAAPLFALSVVAVGFLILLGLRLPARLSRLYSEQITTENGRLASLFVQAVQGFKYLLASARFHLLQRHVDDTARRIADAEARSGLLYGIAISLAQPVVVLFLAVGLYYRAAVIGEPLAPVLILLVYLYRIMVEVFALQGDWQVFLSYTGGLDAVADTLAELERTPEPRGTGAFGGLGSGIELDGVGFSYRERPVLTDVSLHIRRHTTVAIVGESGAGKSTLVDLLTGALRPQEGTVRIDGRPVAELDLQAFRDAIGYVTQEGVAFDDTVLANISLWSVTPEDAEGRARVEAAARQAHCDDFIRAMPDGYLSPVGDRGTKLSGGQRQRLAIARELFKRPELLILDEATSALDSESEDGIRRSIDELRGKMTIVLIAHRLSTIKNSDFIYVLDAGRVVEQGSFAELHAAVGSRFRRMCDLQLLIPS